MPDTGLLGRTGECALLDDVVGAVRRGEGRSLVLRGEAGIGKTALLRYLEDTASDMTVARAAGVESEMELAYAGLHQLCAPLLGGLRGLPAPQRQALATAFGLSAGPPTDRFLVGLAVLSLLSQTGDRRPLLCVVDDAQWLDRSSTLTLAFVARRLLAEPVGIVFATREPAEELRHLPVMELPGLRPADAGELLGTVVRSGLDDRVRDRIVAETRGNPLALLELPRGLTAAELEGGFALLALQDVPRRVRDSFVRRFARLGDDARRLVLLAAADPVGDALLVWRAAERLSLPPAAADEAEAHGLLAIEERVRLRHPLARAAVYQAAAAHERRAVHLALAEATDGEVDRDRRAWHLAAAAAGPDEEVAEQLERSAGRARARGGAAAAASFLQRAVALTVDPGRRGQRALAAADASVQAGAFGEVGELLATAEAAPRDEPARARAELVRGRLALLSTFGRDALPPLLRAARRLEPVDARLARDAYLDAWGAALVAGRLSTDGDLLAVSRAARSVSRPAGAPGPADPLLDGLATLVADGREAAAPLLEEATRAFAGDRLPAGDGRRWGWIAAAGASALWDEESAYAICAGQLRAVRRAGALAELPVHLGTLALLAVRCGDFAAAEEALAEADAVAEATGARVTSHSAMSLLAFRGREVEALATLETARHEAAVLGRGFALELAGWLSALLSNGLGRYQEAVAAAGPAGGSPAEPFVSSWAAMELLEAATRVHDAELARAALERVVAATAFARGDSARGILARSRALVTEGDAADGLYREAVERLGRSRLRPELARAHLLYGEWLRREGRRVDARAQLAAAHVHFTSIGMEAFAERTHRELVATGAHLRRRTDDTRDELTAQESQIARLARDGLSNPEIGARLFLSPRTVEWHLHKVFTKLGIRSRHELRGALPDAGSELAPA